MNGVSSFPVIMCNNNNNNNRLFGLELVILLSQYRVDMMIDRTNISRDTGLRTEY